MSQSRIISAFVVRFLTRRFIGDYSSSICSAYPHTVTLDHSPVAVIVWDTPALSTQVEDCVQGGLLGGYFGENKVFSYLLGFFFTLSDHREVLCRCWKDNYFEYICVRMSV